MHIYFTPSYFDKIHLSITAPSVFATTTIVIDSIVKDSISFTPELVITKVCDEGVYEYGYNGQIKDNEWAGNGNHNTALFWEYDTRIGRRGNLDPESDIWVSPYSTFTGNPILFPDPLGNKISYQSKEEKRDVNYLRRHDPAFNKKFNEWRRIYGGKGKDLYFHKTQDAPWTLNGASPTPDAVVRGGRNDGHDNVDHIDYTAIEGSEQGMYSILNLGRAEQWGFSITTTPGSTFTYRKSFTPGISRSEFSFWSIENAEELQKDPIYQSTKNYSSMSDIHSFIGQLNVNIHNYNKDLNTDYTTKYSYSTYLFYVRAVTLPIIVKVPKSRSGRHLWHQKTENYKVLSGEEPGETSPQIIIEHPIEYLDFGK